MQCFKSPNRNDRGLLIGHVGRFMCQHPIHLFRFFRHTYVLGISTFTKAESCKNLVTFFKDLDTFANCFNFTCKLLPNYFYSCWFSNTRKYSHGDTQPKGEFQTSHFTVPCSYCCRINLDQQFLFLGSRFFYFFKLKNFRLVFIVQENYPPYALSIIEIDPPAVRKAMVHVKDAVGIWRRCLQQDWWPGYPGETIETMEKTLAFIERLKPRLHSGLWVSYFQPCKGTTGYDQAMARNPAFGVARNEDITYVDPNLTRELLQEYRRKMMARPEGVTNPAWRTADSTGTLGAGA